MPYMPEMHSMHGRTASGGALRGQPRAIGVALQAQRIVCPTNPLYSLCFTFLARSDASTSDLILDFIADHKESISGPFFHISCIFPDPEKHFFLSFMSDRTSELSNLASPDNSNNSSNLFSPDNSDVRSDIKLRKNDFSRLARSDI